MRTAFRAGVAIWVASSLAGAAPGQITLGTAFSYQGHLKSAGVPLDGRADLVFFLFPEALGGVAIGEAQTKIDHPVINGLFTVQLDFGQSAFNGSARWLEIFVRAPSGSGTYVKLVPRQPISPTPYAMFAVRAADLQLPFSGTANSNKAAVDVENTGSGAGVHGTNQRTNNTGSLGGPDYGVRSDGDAIVDNGTLHVTSAPDAEPSGGGGVVVGPKNAANVAIDGNEIMARSNGATSRLFINNDGGDVVFGGPVDIGYEVVIHSDGGQTSFASCPAGKRLLGGGCSCADQSGDLKGSYPIDWIDPPRVGWQCLCGQRGTTASAICANVK